MKKKNTLEFELLCTVVFDEDFDFDKFIRASSFHEHIKKLIEENLEEYVKEANPKDNKETWNKLFGSNVKPKYWLKDIKELEGGSGSLDFDFGEHSDFDIPARQWSGTIGVIFILEVECP